ncbi:MULTISPECIES: hypothetical protein [Streptomycetaceae]|uniref:Uncharacterized protein n=1 Tax=Streptantibioticus cattleyicolor (strain ATCC 35852 / DSM 46488 / JCM 4925 / NBRC 14057 / NRRL 8057) TaxID=1003195 RepID=G8WTA0_STREN|nr:MULTISPECIES: hypothetical protein [Streptomycetaceae]AEW92983.1 hypothetical protein SCATT_06120 [Streptantibioticus cattleyicolor NRRL 8057 = DSM 46488]
MRIHDQGCCCDEHCEPGCSARQPVEAEGRDRVDDYEADYRYL